MAMATAEATVDISALDSLAQSLDNQFEGKLMRGQCSPVGVEAAVGLDDATTADSALDLEPAEASAAELAAVSKLRALLEAKGLAASAAADEAHLFTRATLLRFVRARPTVHKSLEMFAAMLRWYREAAPDTARALWHAEAGSHEAALIHKYFSCGAHGVDRRGLPVVYGRYGLLDLEGLIRRVGYERIERSAIAHQVDMRHILDERSRAAGRAFVSTVCVVDLHGLEWRRAHKCVPHLVRLGRTIDENYPERMLVCYVVRAPRTFAMLYRLVAPLLSADTRAKIRIVSHTEDHVAALEKHIERSQIPVWLGGESDGWAYGCGGEVP